MLFERGKAVGIPTNEKCGAQRIVARGNLADARNAKMASFASTHQLQVLFLRGVISGPRVRKQRRREFHAAGYSDKKVHKEQGQQRAADFHYAAGGAPT